LPGGAFGRGCRPFPLHSLQLFLHPRRQSCGFETLIQNDCLMVELVIGGLGSGFGLGALIWSAVLIVKLPHQSMFCQVCDGKVAFESRVGNSSQDGETGESNRPHCSEPTRRDYLIRLDIHARRPAGNSGA
jgi:hypothetical protein